jgi:hypothetical protein
MIEESDGKPLLLIEVVDDPTDKKMPHKLKLNASAVAALSASSERYVAPVTMFGPYRSGKSFLLNQLLQRTQGFDVGGTTRACTKGVWIWSNPVKLDIDVEQEKLPTDMYFLDCEGTNSLERDSAIDSLLATVSIFISSIFMYNSVGAIEEKKLEELAALTLMIDRIAKKNHELGFDIQRDFPQLFWLLRDFTLDLDTNTPQDYLDQCLAEVTPATLSEGAVAEAKTKNKMRKLIKNYFNRRTCLAFCRPTLDEKTLQKIESDDQIKTEFKDEVSDLMQLLIMGAVPKTVNKCYLTGRVFFNFLDTIINALNSGEVPLLSNSVERLLTKEAENKAAQIISSAQETLLALKPKLPLSERELAQKYLEIVSAHLEILREQVSLSSSKETYSHLQKKFLSQLKDSYSMLETENNNVRTKNTSALITNFTNNIPQHPKTATASAAFALDELSPLKPLYTAYFGVGNSKLDWFTLSNFLMESLFEQFQSIQSRTKTAGGEVVSQLEAELVEAKSRESKLRDRILELEQAVKEADRHAQIIKDRAKEEKASKDADIKDIEIRNLKEKLQKALDKLSQEKESHTMYKEKITKLEGELVETGDQMNKKESELQELVDKVKKSEKALAQFSGKLNQEGFNITDGNSSAAFDLIKELSTNVEILNIEIRSRNQQKINILSKQVTECSDF